MVAAVRRNRGWILPPTGYRTRLGLQRIVCKASSCLQLGRTANTFIPRQNLHLRHQQANIPASPSITGDSCEKHNKTQNKNPRNAVELGVLTVSVLFVEQVTTVFRQVLWEGASYRSIPSFLHVIVQAGAEPMSRVHRTLEQTNAAHSSS